MEVSSEVWQKYYYNAHSSERTSVNDVHGMRPKHLEVTQRWEEAANLFLNLSRLKTCCGVLLYAIEIAELQPTFIQAVHTCSAQHVAHELSIPSVCIQVKKTRFHSCKALLSAVFLSVTSAETSLCQLDLRHVTADFKKGETPSLALLLFLWHCNKVPWSLLRQNNSIRADTHTVLIWSRPRGYSQYVPEILINTKDEKLLHCNWTTVHCTMAHCVGEMVECWERMLTWECSSSWLHTLLGSETRFNLYAMRFIFFKKSLNITHVTSSPY